MPLQSQIERQGQLLSLRWGWWHVVCMEKATADEGQDLHVLGSYTLQKEHTFTDPADGEVLELLPGDILRLYRT